MGSELMLKIQFILNDIAVSPEIEAGTRAIDLLRNTFGLTGTKESCGQGECGSCTILVNDEAFMFAFSCPIREDASRNNRRP
jgi:aerobic-type carbon monoxide dehydrogenase small subunit (CoxS/CutS family)